MPRAGSPPTRCPDSRSHLGLHWRRRGVSHEDDSAHGVRFRSPPTQFDDAVLQVVDVLQSLRCALSRLGAFPRAPFPFGVLPVSISTVAHIDPPLPTAEKPREPHEGQGQYPRHNQIHGGSLDEHRHIGQLRFLPQTGHEGQGQGESPPGAEGVDKALQEIVPPVGGEDGEPQYGAVGGDEGQEDAQGAEERRAHFPDDHLHELHGAGDDHDEGNQTQVGGVDQDEGIEDPGAAGGDDHDEGGRQAESEGGLEPGGDPQERTKSQEIGKHEVVDHQGADEYPGKVFHYFFISRSALQMDRVLRVIY